MRNDESGFTLVEVLVAFAVFVLVLMPLLSALTSGTAAISGSSQQAQALNSAQSKLASIGRETTLAPGLTQGDLGGGLTWTTTIIANDASSSGLERHGFRLYWIDVSVYGPVKGARVPILVSLRTARLGHN